MLVNEMLSLVLNGGFFDFYIHNRKYELISLLENGKTNNILIDYSHTKKGCIALCNTLADESDDQYFSSVDDFLKNAQIDGVLFMNALPDISGFHRTTT
ncbi:MAG: hypothetical protein ACI4Q4_03830 [Oscillospiraceae bacterium]